MGKTMKKEETFEEILRECIEETFREILGDAAAAAVLYHVGSRLIDGIEFFEETLERIFGSSAYLLEREIVKKLYGRLNIEFEEKTAYRFSDYIKDAKILWQESR